MQTDAIERLGVRSLLTEPEVLETLEPDVHLVATLAQLSSVIPERSRATARAVVAKVARRVEERIADRLHQSVLGALNRVLNCSYYFYLIYFLSIIVAELRHSMSTESRMSNI